VAALGTVANGGCRNQKNNQDKEERANGENVYNCIGEFNSPVSTSTTEQEKSA